MSIFLILKNADRLSTTVTDKSNLHKGGTIIILKIGKSKICREAVGRGWGEILGNVYISWMCCGFVVNHTYQWW